MICYKAVYSEEIAASRNGPSWTILHSALWTPECQELGVISIFERSVGQLEIARMVEYAIGKKTVQPERGCPLFAFADKMFAMNFVYNMGCGGRLRHAEHLRIYCAEGERSGVSLKKAPRGTVAMKCIELLEWVK